MPTILDQLREFSWKGISFPVAKVHFSLQQDLVEHRFWAQDGANVEATGRAPFTVSATLLFRNNLSRGRTETWGALYPTTFRQFIDASLDRTTGVLVHPEFGPMNCKLKSAEIDHVADRRDGCDVEASWVETREKENTSASAFTQQTQIAEVELAAFDLDGNLSTLAAAAGISGINSNTYSVTLPKTAAYKPNFADSIRSIVAVGDQVSLLSRQVGGQFAAINYRLNQIETSLQGAKSALNAVVLQSINRMRHATNNLQQKLLQKQRETRIYITPMIKTLASISVDVAGNTVGDLIRLNPTLVAFATVPRGTAVRYYAPKIGA